MKVAIIGAGPAGAHLAYELRVRGAEVDLYDAREAWEKPCGGGVTSKALADFPFLTTPDVARKLVRSVRLISAAGRELTVPPRSDFAIFSRRELGQFLRVRAVTAGVRMRVDRVEKTARESGKWIIESASGLRNEVDLLVGADGASSVIRRRVGIRFGPEDFSYGLGWHLYRADNGKSAELSGQVDIRYLEKLGGYLWLFPRVDHHSYGIACGYREASPQEMKERLLAHIDSQDPLAARMIRAQAPGSHFYAAMIPSLGVTKWDRLRASRPLEGWALVGDAAGFVDPLTGEGIYYALLSAGLLARSIAGCFDHYEEMWRDSFGGELRRAAELSERFYGGNYAGASMAERMVQLAAHHRGVRETLRDLISGDQGYIGLKRRLLSDAWRLF